MTNVATRRNISSLDDRRRHRDDQVDGFRSRSVECDIRSRCFNEREPNKIPAEYLGYLDSAVKMILDHGLAAVIDLPIRRAISRRGWQRRWLHCAVCRFWQRWRALLKLGCGPRVFGNYE